MENSELSSALNYNQSAMINKLIGETFIVDYGIITEIPQDEEGNEVEGIVTVALSVTSDENFEVIDCVLLNTVSNSFSVNIKPSAGDKVLVLFPRRFDSSMFDKEVTEPLYKQYSLGYNTSCGLAVLMNQFRPEDVHNTLTLDNGKLDLKLAYSEDDEENLFTLSVDENGRFSLKSKETSVVIEEDEHIKIDNSKASIDISSDGDVVIDNGKGTIGLDKDGNVTINAMSGKISIKNNSADGSLFTLLNGILTILNTSLSTSGSPAKHIVDPNQFQQQVQILNNLLQ